MGGQDGGTKNQALLSSFYYQLFFFFNNTSADVKTICLVPRSLCVISLFTAVFPKRELPSSGSFSKTQFSKQIYTQVSSIFENKGYHIFPRGIDERREDAENRV